MGCAVLLLGIGATGTVSQALPTSYLRIGHQIADFWAVAPVLPGRHACLAL